MRVSIMDLTVAQVEAIEGDVGLPIDKWGSAPSKAGLYVAVLSAATGEDPATYRKMTMRQLIEAVSLDEAEPDPTPPSGP